MAILADLLIAIGVVGLLGSTLGSSWAAWVLSFFSSHRISATVDNPTIISYIPSLDILIPAHNEEGQIGRTLGSIVNSRDLFVTHQRHLHNVQAKIKIVIGVDHCTDHTEQVIREFTQSRRVEGLTIQKNLKTPGKWVIVQQLIKQSQAEWVALVDSGTVWEEWLLENALPLFFNKDVIGVSPSYRPLAVGILERFYWAIERFLKQIESRAGGPTSVHGPTVFYRREALLAALEELSSKNWLNDDVVIPLTLRTLFPKQKIEYLSRKNGRAWILDHGIKQNLSIEYNRRKRMLIGNLQWIRILFWKSFKSSIKVGLIASRRVFRTFWAYWITLLFLGIFLHALNYAPLASTLVAALSIAALALYPLQGTLSKSRAAFRAGLQIPFHWNKARKKTPGDIWN